MHAHGGYALGAIGACQRQTTTSNKNYLQLVAAQALKIKGCCWAANKLVFCYLIKENIQIQTIALFTSITVFEEIIYTKII